MGILGKFLDIYGKSGDPAVKEIEQSFTIASCSGCSEACGVTNESLGPSERYPSSLSLDTSTPLWGSIKPWSIQILCATGKTDWVHSVTDESGTLAQSIDQSSKSWKSLVIDPITKKPTTNRVVISNSSINPPDEYFEFDETKNNIKDRPSRVLILPDFIYIENITPRSAPEDLKNVLTAIGTAKIQTKLSTITNGDSNGHSNGHSNGNGNGNGHYYTNGDSNTNGHTNGHSNGDSNGHTNGNEADSSNGHSNPQKRPPNAPQLTHLHKETIQQISPLPSGHKVIPANDLAYILLCSHRTRDKRCAITANILKKRFELELQERDLYRDSSDDRPNGVRIEFVSHVGGHKFAANCIIYTKSGEAIWLARVRPEHVSKIIEHCVLKGEVFPELLRGAFNTNPIDW